MRNMLDQDGPVMRALSDLSTLVFLNILTMLFCVPVVTAGASLAAMHYVIMEMIEERGGSLFSEFWKRFKENLKNATPIWLIILAVSMFLFIDFRIINSGAAGLPAWMLIPLYAGAFVTAAIYVYVIPLTARFVYSTGAAFKNAAILAVVTRLLPLFFILGVSLPAYFCALMYTPIFKKMIGNTEEEDRPWVLDEEGTEGKEE